MESKKERTPLRSSASTSYSSLQRPEMKRSGSSDSTTVADISHLYVIAAVVAVMVFGAIIAAMTWEPIGMHHNGNTDSTSPAPQQQAEPAKTVAEHSVASRQASHHDAKASKTHATSATPSVSAQQASETVTPKAAVKQLEKESLTVPAPLASGKGPQFASLWVSARDSLDRLSRKADVPFGSDFASDVTVTIDPSVTFQSILGFGGALTEAATLTMSKLNDSMVQKVIDAYYGENGNKYTLGRVHINSCDFSVSSYTFNDVADDFDMQHFDMGVAHDQKTMIPMVRRAIAAAAARNASLKLFATPWSPPAWMKTNGRMTGSASPGLKADQRYHDAWALYITKWLTAYQQAGIDFWGITVQNEPEFAAPWEACVYTAAQERDFVKKHLGPIMQQYHPDTKIMIYDHNKDHIVTWASTIYSDPEAAKYVWGTAFHWYTGDVFQNLATVHMSFPDKHLLASEACNCPGVQLDAWPRGEQYGHDILGDLNNFAEGWTDWNIALDQRGGPNHLGNMCDAPVIIDTVKQTVHFQPPYYFMGHFSRFLPPNSVRLQLKVIGNPQMEATSFRDTEGQIVVVVLNRSDFDGIFKLHVAGTDTYAKVELVAHSIITLVLDKNWGSTR